MNPAETVPNLKGEVSAGLVRRLYGEWTPTDQATLESRLIRDEGYARAWRLAEESLAVLDAHAKTPEIMRHRERSFAHARLASTRWQLGLQSAAGRAVYGRWRWAAGFAVAATALAFAWQLSPWGYAPNRYQTGVGEQRMVDLDDHSRIALDAATRIAVHYSGESRTIELIEGQAQFSVAHDAARPFKVKAGDRTIVALGTVFNVDFTGRRLRVAMVEGRVAIESQSDSGESERVAVQQVPPTRQERRPTAIELSAGDVAAVAQDGRATVIHKADIEAATAWRNGRVVFKGESLGEAVRRINRYSRVQVEIDDPALADEPINGMFDAGDTQGFVNAVRLALPVEVDQSNPKIARLLRRQ